MLACALAPRAWPATRATCAPLLRVGWVVVMVAVLAAELPGLPGHVVASGGMRPLLAMFHPDPLALLALLLVALVGLYAGQGGALACIAAAFAVAGGPLVSGLAGACVIVALHDDAAWRGRGTGGLLGMALLSMLDPIGNGPAAFALAGAGAASRAFVLPAVVLMATWPLLHLSWRPGGGRRHVPALRMADVAGFVVGCHLWLRLLACYPDIPVLSERWGDALVALSAGLFLVASLRALVARDVRRVLSGLFGGTAALPVMLAGLGLVARANDLPDMLGGVVACLMLLLAAGSIVWVALLALCDAIGAEAGRLVLMHLGGLATLMPRLSALLSVGLLALGGMPPLIGFSISWMLLRLFGAMPHGGSLAQEIPVVCVLIVMGAAWGVRLLALVRLVGVVLCGRPRTPRGAGACDPPWPVLGRCAAGVALACVVSLLPGAWIALARAGMARVVRQANGPAGAGGTLFALPSPDGVSVLVPVHGFVLLLVVGAMVGMVWWMRGVSATRQVATWEQGAPPAPPWMPFGDPLTQVGAGVFVRLLQDMAGWPEGAAAGLRRALRAWRAGGHALLLPLRRFPDAPERLAPLALPVGVAIAMAILCWLA
ncbi:proton-conducting transporter transmembrane domain-containing protein [Gluconacetobacter entanii]|uniref:NADH:quinone oxidoreductase/Mrp antiporter transmembrane domain-containing protein n=1 Tax=Gluconacetobacter entanii TaxID=108528 RepID=A0A318Q1T3_9PROT|nr:proton-conducting transporter membrane subunit [Gluconacetobacter entanii]PYD64732.1 hypothetical protein CFR72_00855 [Gluconacetobacter entanii]